MDVWVVVLRDGKYVVVNPGEGFLAGDVSLFETTDPRHAQYKRAALQRQDWVDAGSPVRIPAFAN